MKLSDIKGERTLDVIADIIEPIANIAADEAASALFKVNKDEKISFLERAKKSFSPLLKDHRADVIAILSTLEGVTPAEYTESLSLGKMFKDYLDIVSDKAFFEVFTSVQNPDSSGSALESTEGQAVQ